MRRFALCSVARGLVGLAAASVISIACRAAPPPAAPAPDPVASSSPNTRIVSATVLANECANLGKVNGKLAEDAMNRLVEGCTAIPGGSIRFVATLQPGGRIEIAPVEGQPATVPICVLKHELKHKVALQKACKLEVKLEETAIHLDAGASD